MRFERAISQNLVMHPLHHRSKSPFVKRGRLLQNASNCHFELLMTYSRLTRKNRLISSKPNPSPRMQGSRNLLLVGDYGTAAGMTTSVFFSSNLPAVLRRSEASNLIGPIITTDFSLLRSRNDKLHFVEA